MNEHDNEGILLEDGLPIGNLLKSGGHFTINSNLLGGGGNGLNADDTEFNLFPELDANELDANADDTLNTPIPSPWQLPFEDLRNLMRPLPAASANNPRTVIYKRIVRDGQGEPVGQMATTEQAAGASVHLRLTIHYSGYFENCEQPFDSSYLRGQPVCFISGQGVQLAGLEVASLSMRAGEEAQFVIPYALLFGELGCPPRIPPRADGLFIVQLLRSADVGDADGMERLAEADRSRYESVMPQARNVYKRGLDAFRRADYAMAKRLFHKAAAGLEACTLRDEREAVEQQEFVVRLYTNLAICCNKLQEWKKACQMCKEVERLVGGGKRMEGGEERRCKALFQHGRALLQLGEFRRAEQLLGRAQRLQPTNAEITAELKLLADKMEAHAKGERELWRKAFGMQREQQKAANGDDTGVAEAQPDPVGQLETAFRAATVKCLQEFQGNTEAQAMALPAGLTASEVDCVQRLIGGMSIQLDVRGLQQKTYTLRKVAA